jgi:hypothetical protein
VHLEMLERLTAPLSLQNTLQSFATQQFVF